MQKNEYPKYSSEKEIDVQKLFIILEKDKRIEEYLTIDVLNRPDLADIFNVIFLLAGSKLKFFPVYDLKNIDIHSMVYIDLDGDILAQLAPTNNYRYILTKNTLKLNVLHDLHYKYDIGKSKFDLYYFDFAPDIKSATKNKKVTFEFPKEFNFNELTEPLKFKKESHGKKMIQPTVNSTLSIIELTLKTQSEFKILFQRKKGSDNNSQYAYVYLLMKGDSYLAGSLPAGYSMLQVIKENDNRPDLVCMVTSDVSIEAINGLASVFDLIVEVPYLTYKTNPMRSSKQKEMYGSWMNDSYTKWNCMALTQYRKIIFMDSDVIVLRNMDHLFDLQTPAGTFSNPWAEGFEVNTPGKGKAMENPYINLQQGDEIKSSLIETSLYNKDPKRSTFVVIATSLLLTPSLSDYNNYKKMLESHQPYGYICNSGQDEQSITEFYLRQKKTWTFIDQSYNYIPWHPEWLQGRLPYLFHYFGKKPWLSDRIAYTDLEIWFVFVKKMYNRIPPDSKLWDKMYRQVQVQPPIKMICGYCSQLNIYNRKHNRDIIPEDHYTIDPVSLKLVCPVILHIKKIQPETKMENKEWINLTIDPPDELCQGNESPIRFKANINNEYAFMSNFYPYVKADLNLPSADKEFLFIIDGVGYSSSEDYYMTRKFMVIDPSYISHLRSTSDAKEIKQRAGKGYYVDWKYRNGPKMTKKKLGEDFSAAAERFYKENAMAAMRIALYNKFTQNDDLRLELLKLKGKCIQEQGRMKKDYWAHTGKNMLGRLLMDLILVLRIKK